MQKEIAKWFPHTGQGRYFLFFFGRGGRDQFYRDRDQFYQFDDLRRRDRLDFDAQGFEDLGGRVSSLMVAGAGMKRMVLICSWHSWLDRDCCNWILRIK